MLCGTTEEGWYSLSPRSESVQIIVDTPCLPAEYVVPNLGDVVPPSSLCPRCRKGKPHKHGFYRRFALTDSGSVIFPHGDVNA